MFINILSTRYKIPTIEFEEFPKGFLPGKIYTRLLLARKHQFFGLIIKATFLQTGNVTLDAVEVNYMSSGDKRRV